jgi:hypothetical protein
MTLMALAQSAVFGTQPRLISRTYTDELGIRVLLKIQHSLVAARAIHVMASDALKATFGLREWE